MKSSGMPIGLFPSTTFDWIPENRGAILRFWWCRARAQLAILWF
jgi:hypothetical protein